MSVLLFEQVNENSQLSLTVPILLNAVKDILVFVFVGPHPFPRFSAALEGL